MAWRSDWMPRPLPLPKPTELMKRSSLYDSAGSRLSTPSMLGMSSFVVTMSISCKMIAWARFMLLTGLPGRGVRCSLPTKASSPSAAQASKSA